jgi:hypothetical protein
VLTTTTKATKTTDGHILFERLFQINHVTGANSPRAKEMRTLNKQKTFSSAMVPTARPFDEFLSETTVMTDNPTDVHIMSTNPKSDYN